jgi:uncharacterized protein (DUF427 family)
MALTMGSGPFGHAPAGVFNTDVRREGLLYFEDSPRRIRGVLAGETVVDSRRVKIMHEHGHLPRAYFPRADVRTDLLQRSEHTTHAPGKGDAVYWTLRVNDRTVPNAAWSYPDPPPGAPPLGGYLAFFIAAMDSWLEEDEPMIGHIRDPYHRVDVVNTSRHVRVSLAGTVLAESARTRAIFETGLPTRWYFPPEDVRAALIGSDLQTVCSYKGHADYRSVRVGDEVHENVAWTYAQPRHDAAAVAGYVAFFNERVDIVVDGEPQPSPRSPWSVPGWWKSMADFTAQM